MNKNRTKIGLLLMGVVLAIGFYVVTDRSPVAGQTFCDDTASYSMSSGGIQVGNQDFSSTHCFVLSEIPLAYDYITLLANVTDGELDIYLAPSRESSFSIDDRLNIDPINSESTFAIAPNTTTYTLALAPRGSATVALAVGNSENSRVNSTQSSACRGDTCTRSASTVPATSASTRGLFVDSGFGDRVIVPLRIYCPGRITATASWSGSAGELALILNGPGKVNAYERTDGSPGISIAYDVEYSDLTEGNRWSLSLVNFYGGTARADIDFTLPANTCATGALRQLHYHSREVKTVAFSYQPEGGWAMLYGSNGYWYYNVPNDFADAIREMNDNGEEIRDIAFAPNGGWAIVRGRNGWWWSNVPQGFTDAYEELHEQGEDIRRIDFTASGGWIIIYGNNGRRSVGMTSNFNDNYTELNSQKEYIRTVAFAPGGGWIIIYGNNGWRSVGMTDHFIEILKEYNNAGKTIQDIAFEPDGDWVITVGVGQYHTYGVR